MSLRELTFTGEGDAAAVVRDDVCVDIGGGRLWCRNDVVPFAEAGLGQQGCHVNVLYIGSHEVGLAKPAAVEAAAGVDGGFHGVGEAAVHAGAGGFHVEVVYEVEWTVVGDGGEFSEIVIIAFYGVDVDGPAAGVVTGADVDVCGHVDDVRDAGHEGWEFVGCGEGAFGVVGGFDGVDVIVSGSGVFGVCF